MCIKTSEISHLLQNTICVLLNSYTTENIRQFFAHPK